MVARLAKGVSLLSLVVLFAAVVLASQPGLAQTFITVDYPGATATQVLGINNKGVMVGSYSVANTFYHGFVLQNGIFTSIDFPDAQDTAAYGLNDNGDVVGEYFDGAAHHGFVLSQGVYSTIDVPNSVFTYAQGVNDVGQIVGVYDDASGHDHGFLLSAGVYSTIDFPGSSLTNLYKVSNVGAMVGVYFDSSHGVHGFLLQNGTFTSIDYPGASFTVAFGIDDGGLIVGEYSPPGSHALGFENNSGTFTSITFAAAVDGLSISDINDGGQLAGEYLDATGDTHGFVSATGPSAYVANTGSDTVSMIDIPTSLPVTTIPVGAGPLGVAISPNGKQVYVSNFHGNSVSVIDTASGTVVATIPVQSFPVGVAFTPDGTAAYVANQGSSTVSVIDTASRTVVATVPVGSDPSGVAMALTSNGTFAYVTNQNAATVSVIAVGSNPTVVKTIPVGSVPEWVAVTPDSRLAYVENAGSNNISVISVASNTVTATIPVGGSPAGAAFTPDSSFAYVANLGSSTISVIDTATSSVVTTVPGFSGAIYVTLSTDGASAYVTNSSGSSVSVINTASNTITGTVPVGTQPAGVAIASAPQTELQITQPLSPTQPNNFNFGTNNYQVQYPPGTQFSNVNMTVTEDPITQAQFQQLVAGTPFAGAACIVYAGAGGNCVDDQVTCSNNNGNQIPCPSETQPTIDVQTNFTSSQSIVNPGYLTTPIGQKQWQNIFSEYFGIGPYITVKGKTSGFSEFVAVDLGANNPQGRAQFTLLSPIFPVTYAQGQAIPISFQLTSVVPPHPPVTDAQASISVVMIADGKGNPVQQVVLLKAKAFKQGNPGVYNYTLDASAYAAGIYNVTIYGDAFPAYQGQFTIQTQGGAAVLVAKPTSLTFPPQEVGTNSVPLRDSLFNKGAAQGIVSSVQTTGDFQLHTNHCANGVKPGSHCDVYVVFAPTAVGTRTGTLSYYDNAPGSPQIVSLSGVGTLVRPTTTALSSSPNPSTYGQAVIFTAVVSSSAGAPPDGETVTFMNGTTVLGTGTLSGGSASYTTSTLKVGTTKVTAVYGGDSNFAGSTSNAVSQVVGKATTTTTLISSQNPSKVGQSVTFTATVKPQFSGTVKGTVAFYDGATLLKTVGLSGGVAKFTTATLTSGTHNITAKYNGNASFLGSSASLTQTVN